MPETHAARRVLDGRRAQKGGGAGGAAAGGQRTAGSRQEMAAHLTDSTAVRTAAQPTEIRSGAIPPRPSPRLGYQHSGQAHSPLIICQT